MIKQRNLIDLGLKEILEKNNKKTKLINTNIKKEKKL